LWQLYAAIVAAAYTRALLESMPSQESNEHEDIAVYNQHNGGRERSFVDEIFAKMTWHHPLILLAQADMEQEKVIDAILDRARESFGANNTFRFSLPCSSKADLETYFAYVGKRCGFPHSVTGPVQLQDAFTDLISAGKRLFLLVDEFENGPEESCRELAGILRNLSEKHHDYFNIVMAGGEKLANLKYHPSLEHSLLNNAEVMEWPELKIEDVLEIHRLPNNGASETQTSTSNGTGINDNRTCINNKIDLNEAKADFFLKMSGGHPRLLRYYLQFYNQQPALKENDYYQKLLQYDFLRQIFHPFLKDRNNADRIRKLLEKEEVWQYYFPYVEDPLIRKLYWKNLIVKKIAIGGMVHWVWRCEAIREAGRRVLR
ncbi:MAG: hypothetical protein AB1847_16605, partial [bacterium]